MPPSEQAANILEIYANRIRLLDDMRTSLSEELAEIRMIKEELTQARDDFRQATARLSDTLHLLNVATPLIAAAPFKRNRSTDYSGPLFGTSGETSVMINNDWGEPFVGEW